MPRKPRAVRRIEGKIVIGAPYSIARYTNACTVCDNCLTTQYGSMLKYVGSDGAIGTCYVCEGITIVYLVEGPQNELRGLL